MANDVLTRGLNMWQALGAIIPGITGLVGAGINSYTSQKNTQSMISAQDRINQQNIASVERMNQQNIDFQKAENDITRQREDTAHQREVMDLQAAGLSPLANLGGAQSQALSAPQVQAAQADANGYLQAYELAASADQASINMALSGVSEAVKTQTEKDISENQLENAITVKKMELDQQASEGAKNRTQQQQQHLDNLNEIIRNNNIQDKSKTRGQAIEVLKEEKSRVGNLYKGIKFDEYDDEEQYQKAITEWYDWAKDNLPSSDTETDTLSYGGNADVSFGKSKNILGKGLSALTGLEAELDGNVQKTSTTTKSGHDGSKYRPYPVRSAKLLVKNFK